jgi:hypothetical protein
VEHGLGGEAPDVLVLGGVEDLVSHPLRPHQTGQTQLGQVLGHCGWLGPDVVRQLVDGVLPMQQRPHDPQPGRVAQQPQHHGRRLNLILGRFASLRSHADSLAGLTLNGNTSGRFSSPPR